MRDHGSTPYPKEYPPRAPVSSGTAQNERPDPEDDDAHRAPCVRTGLPNDEAEAEEEGRCLHCGDDLDEASMDDLGHECYPCALANAINARDDATAALKRSRAFCKAAETTNAAWEPVVREAVRCYDRPGAWGHTDEMKRALKALPPEMRPR